MLGASPAVDLEGGLEDLPLWRVQWSVLPGTLQTLHVHVPHYGAPAALLPAMTALVMT